MNTGFRLRYDQLKDNDPTGQDGDAVTEERYPNPGHTRNVCVVWPDGRRTFFNYAYLVTGEFDPNGERNLIKLSFSSHTVALYGYGLEPLFVALLDHLPRSITVIDPRYLLDENQQRPIVVEIRVDKNQE